MKQILVGLIIAFCAPMAHSMPDELPASNGELLELLDGEIEKRGKYEKEHRIKIDSIRMNIAMTTDSVKLLKLYQNLGNAFHELNADSAVIYFTKGLEIAKATGDSANSVQPMKV